MEKMSKSLGNYIGIEESPKEIFGKTMSISDDLMWRYYELCTDLSLPEIARMKADVLSGALHPRKAKINLASLIVAGFHGESAGAGAAAEFDRVFSQHETPDEIAVFDIPPTGSLVEFLVVSGVSSSNTQARTLISAGAVRVDEAVIKDVKWTFANTGPSEFLVKAGKRQWRKARRP